jgi:hypothetical protein
MQKVKKTDVIIKYLFRPRLPQIEEFDRYSFRLSFSAELRVRPTLYV